MSPTTHLKILCCSLTALLIVSLAMTVIHVRIATMRSLYLEGRVAWKEYWHTLEVWNSQTLTGVLALAYYVATAIWIWAMLSMAAAPEERYGEILL